MTTPESPIEARSMVTVVLIDDHAQLADVVSMVLNAHEQIEVVALASSCASGLSEVERHQPDVCLLDQRLPDGLGTDLIADLRRASSSTKVLVMTGDDNADVQARALEGGGVGVISKGLRMDVLHGAVLAAARGGAESVRRVDVPGSRKMASG